MKLKNYTFSGLLAIALAALATNAAHATTYSGGFTAGDWLLGVYDAGASSGNEFAIDLGSGLDPTVNHTWSDSSFHIGDDLALTTAFGSSWWSDANLYYGVAATLSSAATLYTTDPDSTTSGPAEKNGYGTTAGVAINDIAGDINTQVQVSGQQSTGEVYPLGTVGNGINGWNNIGYTLNGFWSGQSAGDGGIDAGIQNSVTFFKDATHTGGGTVHGTVLGTFSFDSAGDLNYTAAVPEPSTIAGLAVGAAALAFLRRRKVS